MPGEENSKLKLHVVFLRLDTSFQCQNFNLPISLKFTTGFSNNKFSRAIESQNWTKFDLEMENFD